MEKKINLHLIGIAVLAILVTLASMLTIFYDVYEKQVQEDLNAIGNTIKSMGVFHKNAKRNISFDEKDVRVTWIDQDGTVLYDNGVDAGQMGNHAERPEVREAFADGKGEAVRDSETMNKSTFYCALRMDDGTVLRVAKEKDNIFSIIYSAIPILVITVVFMIVLCIFLARLMTKSIINPIEEMTGNIDDPSYSLAYKELIPFVNTIRSQHIAILEGAKLRQDFTANVSHELKTPLTAISGYAELMENGMVDSDEIEKFSAKIRMNAERLLNLINDIIRLSELDDMEEMASPETFDLHAAAEHCVDTLKVYAHKHDVTILCTGVPASLNGNKDMIAELIDNLGNNAVRYNNKGGTVVVEVGVKDGHPFLKVKDTGIGIPKEHQSRVFERFYRVDKSRSKRTGGTGLGLAIVKHIVAIHHAELSLTSEEGRGTEITVTF